MPIDKTPQSFGSRSRLVTPREKEQPKPFKPEPPVVEELKPKPQPQPPKPQIKKPVLVTVYEPVGKQIPLASVPIGAVVEVGGKIFRVGNHEKALVSTVELATGTPYTMGVTSLVHLTTEKQIEQ